MSIKSISVRSHGGRYLNVDNSNSLQIDTDLNVDRSSEELEACGSKFNIDDIQGLVDGDTESCPLKNENGQQVAYKDQGKEYKVVIEKYGDKHQWTLKVTDESDEQYLMAGLKGLTLSKEVSAMSVHAQEQPVGTVMQNPDGNARATTVVTAPEPVQTLNPQDVEEVDEINIDLGDAVDVDVGDQIDVDAGAEDDYQAPPPVATATRGTASATPQPVTTRPVGTQTVPHNPVVTHTTTQLANPPVASPPAYPAPAQPAPANPVPANPAPAPAYPAPAPAYPAPAPAVPAYPVPVYPAPAPEPAQPFPANPSPLYPAPANPAPARPPTVVPAPFNPAPAYPPPAYNTAPVPANPSSVPTATLPASPVITSAFAVPTGNVEAPDYDPEADMDDVANQEVFPGFPAAVLPDASGVLNDGPLFQTANPFLGGFPGMPSSMLTTVPSASSSAVSSAAQPSPVTLREVTASAEGSTPSAQPQSAASKLTAATFSVAALMIAGVLLL
ncbi:hypothetical protein INT43_004443 [Umbelopsis isabellina]|uniref:Uncharacterized protein n=1 Tax=Mortierella isabellina TaxID=91625 RepID=A0A8H7PIJ0_MORIS|nr:hypothetical protein INT43_004443 [Umbelopsis isabellina]